jgi:hypothetical protein
MGRPTRHRARFIDATDDLLAEIAGLQAEGYFTRVQVDMAWAHLRRGLLILGYPHFRKEPEETEKATPASVA